MSEPTSTYSGRAQGGPLHNIVITSGIDWNGFIQKDNSGRYRWNSVTSRWDWVNRVTPIDQSLSDLKPIKKSRRKSESTTPSS